MKKAMAGLLVFLIILAGAGYLLYPTLSDQISRREDETVLKAYRGKTAGMDSARKAELFAEAKAYNEGIEQISVEDMFSGGTPRTTRDYQNHLNVHSGVLAELVIPEIGVSLPVYHQSTETPAGQKLVHIDGTSLPADDESENIVLAGPGILRAEGILGEIGLTDGRMLEDLDRLKPDDIMVLNVLDRTMVYRVKEVRTLSASGLKELDLTPGEGEKQLTLISQRADRRLLVRTEEIPIREARTLLEEEDRVSFTANWKNVLFLGSPVILAGLLVLFVIERIKRRKYMLPGEGRNAAGRRKKSMEKLENLQASEPKQNDNNQQTDNIEREEP